MGPDKLFRLDVTIGKNDVMAVYRKLVCFISVSKRNETEEQNMIVRFNHKQAINTWWQSVNKMLITNV